MRRVAIARCKLANTRADLGATFGFLQLVPRLLLRHAQLPAVVPELKRHVRGGDQQQARSKAHEANAAQPRRASDRGIERQRAEREEVAAEAPQEQARDGRDNRELRERLQELDEPVHAEQRGRNPRSGFKRDELRRQRLGAERPAAERDRAARCAATTVTAAIRQQTSACRRSGRRAGRACIAARIEQRLARHFETELEQAFAGLPRSSR